MVNNVSLGLTPTALALSMNEDEWRKSSKATFGFDLPLVLKNALKTSNKFSCATRRELQRPCTRIVF